MSKAIVTKVDISKIKGKFLNVNIIKDVDSHLTVVRTLWDGKQPLTAELLRHVFLGHEVSAYANKLIGNYPWIDIVTDDPEILKDICENGWSHEVYGDWKYLFGTWRDRKGKVILVPYDCPINNLNDIGIYTPMTAMVESMKMAKYLNRLFAPSDEGHEPLYGKEEADSWVPETKECQINLDQWWYRPLILKYVDLDSLSPEEVASKDGHIGLSLDAHKALGLSNNPQVGDSWRVTVMTQRGMGKGHTIYQPDQVADIVIYGAKKPYGEHFAFISLGPLHSGNPNTDLLSVTNFKLGRLVEDLAKKNMRWVYQMSHSAKAWLTLLKQVLRADENDADLDAQLVTDVADKYVLRRILMAGISPFSFAGNYRRLARHFLSGKMRFEQYKVPMNMDPSCSVATSKYASGCPFAVNEDGTPNMDKTVIQEGECVSYDLADGQEVIIYRQPNENGNAFYRLVNRHYPGYESSAGSSVLFLGRGVQHIMGRLGGGDMDDALIIITDPIWIEHFKNLTPYPETAKIVPEAVQVADAAWLDENVGDISQYDDRANSFDISVFGPEHAVEQITAMSSREAVGIGPVVNVCMIDRLLSDPDERESLNKDLFDQGANSLFFNWLKNFEPNTSSFLSSNQEIVIDGAVKDPALLIGLSQLAQQFGADNVSDYIRKFHAQCMIYPKCMTVGRNRIPQSKQEAGNYVIAMTEQCRSQERMLAYKSQLMNKLAENEWKLVQKADPVISSLLPEADDRLKRLVHGRLDEDGQLIEGTGVRGYWRKLWAEHSEYGDSSDRGAYGRICMSLDIAMDQMGLTQEDVEAMALELYRTVYRTDNPVPQQDFNGNFRSYHDGLLWTNRFANAFLNILGRNGLLGAILPVKLYNDRHLAQVRGVKVHLKEGIVYKVAGNSPIGTVAAKNKVGIFTMNYGFIQFKKCDTALMAKEGVIGDIEPMVFEDTDI